MRSYFRQYTIYLLIGFAIVTIARMIYSPVSAYDLWQIAESDGIPRFLVPILCIPFPTMAAFVDMGSFIIASIYTTGSTFNVMLSSSTIMLTYCAITFLLEKIHVLYDEEGLMMYVELICIENILLYVYEIVIFFISSCIMNINIESNPALYIITVLLTIVASLVVYIHMLYLLCGIMINIMLPAILTLICMSFLSYIAVLIFFPAAFLGVYLWRKISDRLYNFMITKLTFGHISLY